jgi:ribose transport system substrate-binding protein
MRREGVGVSARNGVLRATVASALLAASLPHASAQDVVAGAKAEVEKYTGPQNEWLGPTLAPKPQPGKKIVFLVSDQRLEIDHLYSVYFTDAAKALGWTVTVIDGKGMPSGWLTGMNEAVALKPDGIAVSADVRGLQQPIRAGVAQGIKFVGLHAAGEPGPQPDLNLFTNIQGDPRQIGDAQGAWIIANSNGAGNVVIITHNEYSIAHMKSSATQDEIAKCTGCKVDEYSNTPAGEAPQRMPQLMTSWLQRFKPPFYITTVGDADFDYLAPVLRNGRIEPTSVKLVGADGYKSAYERIRKGEYQAVTVPEPIEEQGYQAADELNRAFNGQPPSGFVQPPYLVTRENVDKEGGDKNSYFPTNGYKEKYKQIWGVAAQ